MNGGWNHNIQYHAAVLDSVPADAHTALDVGCGEGLLTRRLRRTVPHVVGIDIHEPSIAQARYADDIGIEYVVGDFLTHPFEAESFDFIASVASLHHNGRRRGAGAHAAAAPDRRPPGGRRLCPQPPGCRSTGRPRGRHRSPLAHPRGAVGGGRLAQGVAAIADVWPNAAFGHPCAAGRYLPAAPPVAVHPDVDEATLMALVGDVHGFVLHPMAALDQW
ncbi:MAG: class I SAM-dependent methyltransferase [Acidimicrobiales bacterium]